MSDAADGRANLVLVEGEPGIGKTTVCEAFLDHAARSGWRTATGRCVEPGLAPSLWPCIEVVRSMIGNDPGRRSTRTATLGSTVTGDAHAAASLSPVQLAEEFIALADDLGDPPWVILLDDLHWADQATLRLLALVLERLDGRRMLAIGAYRPPESVPGSLLRTALGGFARSIAVSQVQLSPLGSADVGVLIEQIVGAAPAASVTARVHERAGGNPLFVAELARLMGQRGVTIDTEVPAAIRDVVRARLAHLPDSSNAELQVAAVLGERFDLRTAVATSERDADSCLDALDAAIVTRILVPDGVDLRFAHALVRDAVLAEIPPLRLARLHHRAADAILATRGDGPEAAEPIAHHRLASASVSDPVVVARAALRASDVARWRSAFDTADRLAQSALDVIDGATRTPETIDAEVEALEALVGTARRRGDPSTLAAVTDRIEALAARSGHDAARSLVVFLRWGIVDETTDLDDLLPTIREAEALAATTDDPYAIVSTRFILAAWAWLRGSIDESLAHIEVALDASGATDPDARPHHVPLALLPPVASFVAAVSGDAACARVHAYRRTRAWMGPRNQVDPAGNVALVFYRSLVEAILDEPRRVIGQLAMMPSTNPGHYVAFETAACTLLRAWADARSGDLGGPERALEAMTHVETVDEHILRSCLRTFVADACLVMGDDRAVALLDVARAEAVSRKETWWLAETIRLQSSADRRFGTGAHADGLLSEADLLARSQGAHLLVARIATSRKPAQPAPV